MPVKMIMTPCGSATEVVAVHGVEKDQLRSFKAFSLREGSWEAFAEDRSGALVGHRIAIRRGWQVGEQVTVEELDGLRFTVHGVFTTHGTADDFLIFTGRRFLQEAADEQGISNHVLVRLQPGADGQAVAAAIDALPLTVETTTQLEEAHLGVALDNLADLASVSRTVSGVTVLVILIAIGNAVSMSTRDRAREFGVLRTLGYGRGSIAFMVLAEGLVQALIGGLLGCALVQALTSFNLISSISTCDITVVFSAGPAVWGIAVGTIFAAALLGCLAPALRVARLPVVVALRRED